MSSPAGPPAPTVSTFLCEHTCAQLVTPGVWVLESLWEAPPAAAAWGEALCQADAPRPQRQMGWRRPWSLSPQWGLPEPGGCAGLAEEPSTGCARLCGSGSALGGALPRGLRQGRLTPGGLWASAPAACAPLTGWEIFSPSHLTVLGMQVHLELLGHNHRSLQTETPPGSSLKVFPPSLPTPQEI